MRILTRALAPIALICTATPGAAQSLAARVAQAPDGIVRIQLDSRPGVCGNGRDIIGFRNALFGRSFRSIGGHWTSTDCVPGPLRVSLTVANGDVRQLRTQVGGSWPATGAGVTDLGTVPAAEGSGYFFSLVPRLERVRDDDRFILPAVLADAEVEQPLRALAVDTNRLEPTRRSAIFWLGQTGDARTFTFLKTYYTRSGSGDVKDAIIQAIAQDDSDDGERWLLARARDEGERRQQRKNALFWAGQREGTPTAELVRAYRDLRDTELREHAIFVLSQRKDDAAVDELMRIAREDRDTDLRGKALFWLAQNDDPRVRKLIADLILR